MSRQGGDDDDRYPEVPGWVADSDTSAAAATAAKEFAPSLADWCEHYFKEHTERQKPEYMTCEECEIAAQAAGGLGKHQTISARIRTDLYIKRQCLWKIGTSRTSGQEVKVWYSSDTSNLRADAKGRITYRTKPNTSGRRAWVYGWGYRKKRLLQGA